MPEYDVTFSFEKTFRVKAKNYDIARHDAIEKLVERIKDIENEDAMNVEIYHVKSE